MLPGLVVWVVETTTIRKLYSISTVPNKFLLSLNSRFGPSSHQSLSRLSLHPRFAVARELWSLWRLYPSYTTWKSDIFKRFVREYDASAAGLVSARKADRRAASLAKIVAVPYVP